MLGFNDDSTDAFPIDIVYICLPQSWWLAHKTIHQCRGSPRVRFGVRVGVRVGVMVRFRVRRWADAYDDPSTDTTIRQRHIAPRVSLEFVSS